MEVILGLIPLDLHIMELAARSRIRTKPLVNGMESMRANKALAKLMAIKDTGINSQKAWRVRKEHSWIDWETPGEEVELTPYAEGASNNRGAGYGFAAFESNSKEKRRKHSEKGPLGRICPCEAELYAERAALNWLVSNPQRLKDNVILYTDSRPAELVLKVLKNQKHCCALGDGPYSKSQRDLSFGIRWIKGYGNRGQELVDSLAKEAAKKAIEQGSLM